MAGRWTAICRTGCTGGRHGKPGRAGNARDERFDGPVRMCSGLGIKKRRLTVWPASLSFFNVEVILMIGQTFLFSRSVY